MAESDLVGPVAYAQRVVKGWGLEHKKAMRQQFGRALSVAGLGESLPNPGSYVSLSEKKDAMGLPMALIRSRVDEMALARLRFMAETCRKILRASGAGPVFEEFSSADAFSSTHVFGTCRMSSSAKTGVVDAYCKSFRWPNLYIVDGSVFPSSGGGESPGLTIQALALRASDALNKNHRG
jgi:choline dehydrogenase-like flavoprotein